jgi:hypothetical protein
MVHPDVMASLLQMSHLRSQFLSWLAGEMRHLSQKRNKLAWLETLDLKTGGATGSALKIANKKSRCIPLLSYCLRIFVSKATYYRQLSTHVEEQQEAIQSQIGSDGVVALHWLDNYSKFYKASGMYSDKQLVQNALWTAHGVKMLPSQVSLQWSPTPDGTSTISALPQLDQLLANPCHTGLLSSLRAVSYYQYENAIVVKRDVRRIPLKLDVKTAIDANEASHLRASLMVYRISIQLIFIQRTLGPMRVYSQPFEGSNC